MRCAVRDDAWTTGSLAPADGARYRRESRRAIAAFGGRWLVTWEQNPSHDNPRSSIRADFVNSLLEHGADDIQPVLACIVDTVSERDRELLDELERLVKEKKRQLKGKAD